MPSVNIDPRLVEVAIQNLPSIVALIKNAFGKANPDAPMPTDEEVHAAYIAARDSSLAKDDDWLKAHPGA